MNAAEVRQAIIANWRVCESAAQVIWTSGANQALVHLDSIAVHLLDGIVVVAVELESEQTGRGEVIVTLAVGSELGRAGQAPLAVAPVQADGDPVLAGHFGQVVTEAVWTALLHAAGGRDEARPTGAPIAPGRIAARPGDLLLMAEEPRR